jgi:hypothetical protein
MNDGSTAVDDPSKKNVNELGLSFKYGATPTDEVGHREIVKEPSPRVKIIRDLYFETKSSITMEFPYWYSRRWFELEGEVQIVRRAEALKSAFSHLTPVIFPGELLVMGKTHYLRGSYPMPWLSESFFMSVEDEMYQEALDAGMVSSDTVTKWGKGGGNVTESGGNILSVAGKFGMRKDELSILIKLAHMWKDKSVEDIGHKYEMMVPGYDVKEQAMRSVICMFDSGYTIPQGREVMNYYYPLQYGIGGPSILLQGYYNRPGGYTEMDAEPRRGSEATRGHGTGPRAEARIRGDRGSPEMAIGKATARLPRCTTATLDVPRGRPKRGLHIRPLPRTPGPGPIPMVEAGYEKRHPDARADDGAPRMHANEIHRAGLLRLNGRGGRRAIGKHIQQHLPRRTG